MLLSYYNHFHIFPDFATRLHAVLTQDIFGHLIDFESKESRDCNYMPGILKYLVNIYFLIEPDQNPALCSCTES